MSGRVIRARKFVVGGVKVTNYIEDFEQPEFNKVYDKLGGSFVESSEHVGFEEVKWKITIKGINAQIVRDALTMGDETVCIFTEKGKDGSADYNSVHTMTGEVSVKFSPSKMKERQTITLEGSIQRYSWLENGTPIHDIDIPNGDYLIGGKKY